MMKMSFPSLKGRSLKVLCLGSHSDDIEIGCSGTLSYIAETYPNIDLTWVVFSGGPKRKREAVVSAYDLLGGISRKRVLVKHFKESFFPSQFSKIKLEFERLKSQIQPDIIFTHCRQDLHQDHRAISELTWNTWRSHLILEYEIPKYDGDLGSPNVFVPLPKRLCVKKISHLMKHFKSQRSKAWFTQETFWAMLRIRGVESSSPTEYAEGFYCRKLWLA